MKNLNYKMKELNYKDIPFGWDGQGRATDLRDHTPDAGRYR